MDWSPPGSSVHGILQTILEWLAVPSSRGSSRPRDWTWVSWVSCIGRGGSLPLAPPVKRSQPSGRTNPVGTSISVFQPAELGGRKFLLSKSPCLWYLVNHSLGKLVQTSPSDFELPADRDLELLIPGSLAPGNLTGCLQKSEDQFPSSEAWSAF